ncbi:MAG: 50S ribosome-binding GTPase [Candidatus Aenigmarchaeota archaeon]|nr:50S ribosome-binding GTPase [Candidatus Aenigmarchaeota archaeon]
MEEDIRKEMLAEMPEIPTKKILLDRAFKKASTRASVVRSENKEWAAREKESIRIGIAGDILATQLEELVTNTFSYDRLTPFYKELVGVLIDVDHFKKALGSLKWASQEIRKLKSLYLGRLRNSRAYDTMRRQRIEFYGIASATIDKMKKEFAYLAECKSTLENMPHLKELPTVVIAGMPNVGKSSLLAALTGSRPEVQPYPFTTKGLMVSYAEGHYGDIQVIDTPGLLDRPLKDRNKIERQAIAALKHIASVIVYIYDPSDTAYAMEQQESLFKEIKAAYKIPIVTVYNKCDIARREGARCVSAVTREGVDELWNEALRMVYRRTDG